MKNYSEKIISRPFPSSNISSMETKEIGGKPAKFYTDIFTEKKECNLDF
jgi:hypothetical protein